jgi:hypothetical protein
LSFTALRGFVGDFSSGHGLGVGGGHPISLVTFMINESIVNDSNTLFFSWMSDRPNWTNRSFIESCVEKALKQAKRSEAIKIRPRIDQDARGGKGTSDLAVAIFDKIAKCRLVVADVTLINTLRTDTKSRILRWFGCESGRPTPNPNVLLELGYGVGIHGWEKCIMIANTAYGAIEELPFDIRSKTIVPYFYIEKSQKEAATTSFVASLKSCLESALAD